jgi:hypothetical protein
MEWAAKHRFQVDFQVVQASRFAAQSCEGQVWTWKWASTSQFMILSLPQVSRFNGQKHGNAPWRCHGGNNNRQWFAFESCPRVTRNLKGTTSNVTLTCSAAIPSPCWGITKPGVPDYAAGNSTMLLRSTISCRWSLPLAWESGRRGSLPSGPSRSPRPSPSPGACALRHVRGYSGIYD